MSPQPPTSSSRRAPPPATPTETLVGRLRRAFNAVRDAQEMTERVLRGAPAAIRPKLREVLDDLEWTGRELTTALDELTASASAGPG